MIFDELGLPRDTGASDKEDSARLAGVMCVFEYPGYNKIPITYYLQEKYVRHPEASKYDFSRDQAVPLVAGFWKMGYSWAVNEKYVVGKDIFSPSVKGHFRHCSGGTRSWFQEQFLWVDIFMQRKGQETNQLLCMLMTAGPKWVKRYCKHCPTWELEILDYWDSWRGEAELAQHMIRKIKEVIK